MHMTIKKFKYSIINIKLFLINAISYSIWNNSVLNNIKNHNRKKCFNGIKLDIKILELLYD